MREIPSPFDGPTPLPEMTFPLIVLAAVWRLRVMPERPLPMDAVPAAFVPIKLSSTISSLRRRCHGKRSPR